MKTDKKAHENDELDCELCCEHDDHDGHCCLICGKDMTETLVARAEASADSLEDR